MKKIITIVLITGILTLFSCQRIFQSLDRSLQSSSRSYQIKMYSGDSLVFHDEFDGILNQEEHSDGVFYFKGDTLIEVSGNYIVKSEN